MLNDRKQGKMAFLLVVDQFEERFRNRSQRVAWVKSGLLATLLGFVSESYLWTLNHAMPPGYMLMQ